MEIHEERPRGITIIATLFLLTACLNVYRGIFGDFHLGYVLIGVGILQVIVGAMFYGLDKKAYYVVSAINIIALILSSLFIVKGTVQLFQSDIAVLEILLFLPPLAISWWVLTYLKQAKIKALFQ